MDHHRLAARIAGRSPDRAVPAPRLRMGVSAGPDPADRAGTIRVTLDGTTTPGGATSLIGPVPAGQPVWVLTSGGSMIVLGYHRASAPPDLSTLTVGQSTIPRLHASSGVITQTSQLLRLTYFTATRSEPVVSLRLVSGSTAAGATPTLCRAGLYSVSAAGDLTLIGAINNDTSLFAATSTTYTRALAAPAATVAGARYALGTLVVTTATAPQVGGFSSLAAGELAVAPRITGSVSGQTDLPSSIAAGSVGTSGGAVYGVLLPS